MSLRAGRGMEAVDMLDENANLAGAEEGVLYLSEGTLIQRVRLAGVDRPVVVKRALRDDATRRLRHEMVILERLADVPGVVRVVRSRALEQLTDSVLVLQDEQGVPLAQMLQRGRLGLNEVMRLALQLAQAVANLHAAGVVHKDLSPHNVLVGEAWRVVLIDFGHASTTAEERPAFEHQSQLGGTLAYMSPEQTGRTGRATDNRSDLYSLGVILYELATGQRPFDSEDPLDLIHDHLVRAPAAPVTLHEQLPSGLSDVILKLLQKDPDSRYQSAAGLVHDLELLLAGEAANGQLLELGQHDFPARLPAPSRLAGREAELARLHQAMDQAATGQCRVVLVSGPPGVGKTALIGELRSIVGARRGWFVSCKFDQHAQDSLAAQQTLRALGRLMLAEPEARLAEQRERLLLHLGSNVGFGPALLPEFRLLLGEQQPVVTDPRNADARQLQATLDLLRGIASPDRPVVQVFDDLQWAPDTVLRLLDAVLGTYEPIAGLLVVATYRSNEVGPGHPLSALLARWQEQSQQEAIVLDNLPPADLSLLAGQMLRMPASAVQDLAQTLAQRTDGNPFDTIELINVLRQDGLLTHRQGRWQWDAQAIRHHVGDSDVVQLLQRRLQRLPDQVVPLLNSLACLGGQVRLQVLQELSELNAEALNMALWPALQDGLLVVESSRQTELRFKHDRVQQAVLQSLGKAGAAQLHLQLARALAHGSETGLLAAEQYLLAVQAGQVVQDDAERRRVIALLLPAAGRAEPVNLTVAAQMLSVAIQLADQTVDVDPALQQQLDIALHRVRYGQSEFELADEIYARIVGRSPNPVDLARPACVQIASLAKRSLTDEAVQVGLAQLARLGLSIPDNLEQDNAQSKARLLQWIDSDDRLADFDRPLLTDPHLLACAALIGQTCFAATTPTLGRYLPVLKWLTGQAASLWMQHGPGSELASGGMSYAGAFIGFETGNTALMHHVCAVTERRAFHAATPELRVRLLIVEAHLQRPIEDQVTALRQVREELRRLGVYAGAASTSQSVLCLMDCAETLDVSFNENALFTTFVSASAIRAYLPICQLRQQLFLALRGEEDGLDGSEDDDGVIKLGTSAYSVNYYLLRTIHAFIFVRRAWLLRNAERAAAPTLLSPTYPGIITRALVAVYRAERVRGDEPAQRAAWLEGQGAEDLQWLIGLASQAPANYLHLLHWLEAERAWTAGEFWAACQAFDRAMVKATQNHRP